MGHCLSAPEQTPLADIWMWSSARFVVLGDIMNVNEWKWGQDWGKREHTVFSLHSHFLVAACDSVQAKDWKSACDHSSDPTLWPHSGSQQMRAEPETQKNVKGVVGEGSTLVKESQCRGNRNKVGKYWNSRENGTIRSRKEQKKENNGHHLNAQLVINSRGRPPTGTVLLLMVILLVSIFDGSSGWILIFGSLCWIFRSALLAIAVVVVAVRWSLSSCTFLPTTWLIIFKVHHQFGGRLTAAVQWVTWRRQWGSIWWGVEG